MGTLAMVCGSNISSCSVTFARNYFFFLLRNLNAANRLRFFQHGIPLLESLVADKSPAKWELWVLHVRLVYLTLQHSITSDAVSQIPAMVDKYLKLFASEYGAKELTPNSHWYEHMETFIRW